MKCVISIVKPGGMETLSKIAEELKLPLVLTVHGHGTATKSMLSLLGISSRENRVMISFANDEQLKALIGEQRQRLYIDAPGNGVTMAVPLKSVGGGRTLSYLNGGQPVMKENAPEYESELILAIANEGYNEMVMDAARVAGARGGTVIHAKGTGAKFAAKFFNVSIASEKELILIMVKSTERTKIMTSILKLAGPDTDAGAVVFSLPVTDAAGFKSELPAETTPAENA